MEEYLNLMLKAREILVSESHEEVAMVIDHLFKRQDSEEYKTSRALYDICVSCNPGCLTLKLLKVYQSSSSGILRLRSISQLSETLTYLKNQIVFSKFSLDSLYEIKPLLILCLTMQETKESDIKILRKIVSFVTYNVVELHKDKWDELGDCILSLASSKEPVKAFHVFIDLPPVYKSFIGKFLDKILEEASNVFLYPYRVEDWSLALQTFVKMWIQLEKTGVTVELLMALMEIWISSVVNSVKKLVEMKKEQFLVRGLEDFESFFSGDMNLYHYTKDQFHFVLASMNEIEGVVGTETKEIVRKIKMLVTEPYDDLKNRREEFERGWYDILKDLSSLEVLKILASSELEDRSKEIAIRRLNVLLSDHTSKKVQIDISEMRQLQPLLISCLKEEGLSFNSMFKVLGEVVNHVAYEMLIYQEETWYELRDYIASSKTEFHRAVYIFQCLTMALIDDDFVIPVMENLFLEIITRLDPPRELLVDNSSWVLAFMGGFCLAIHLIEMSSKAESVKEIAHKMIDSIRELMEREMEVGLVKRGFRDVESIVKKQLEWYTMGGHGGLNILPQKRWNVYNFDNREKVRKAEEAAAREEQIKREEARKRDAESRLEVLRNVRGLAPLKRASPEAEKGKDEAVVAAAVVKSTAVVVESVESEEPKTEKEEDEERSGCNGESSAKDAAARAGDPDEEKYRLGYGVAGKGVKRPWYLEKRNDENDSVRGEDDDGGCGGYEAKKKKMSGKKSLKELREERLKRERVEKERERALFMKQSQRAGGFSRR
ncbi:hypothetical protein [Arabidopsis thaliana]|uniref:Uncharacterized protein AT4g16530 n=1 Tax=Arabidopsis thaliana TaxID=3702 RepID=O23497_ARATH|nr:hypothetical protein [Arabidopsis thaliana]CAB78695.1 hypothetical protein [Arabidopsis thaliana]